MWFFGILSTTCRIETCVVTGVSMCEMVVAPECTVVSPNITEQRRKVFFGSWCIKDLLYTNSDSCLPVCYPVLNQNIFFHFRDLLIH